MSLRFLGRLGALKPHVMQNSFASSTQPQRVRLPVSLYGAQATYANALFRTATRENVLDKVEKDMNSFKDLLKSSSNLRTYLMNPIISRKDKASDISKISAKMSLTQTSRGFLSVVAENGRLRDLEVIIGKFNELMKAKNDIVEAKILTASKLAKKEMTSLEAAVKKNMKGKIVFTYEVDPSVLGGLQLQVGDKFLDLSVQNQISKLNQKLTGSA